MKSEKTMQSLSHRLPANACDCHVHVFDPARHHYAGERSYTPEPALVGDLRVLHRRLGIERVILVQPSVYGTDNACMLDALRQLGPQRARGIAVVDVHAISDGELERLHEAGVRGVRLNLRVQGGTLESARHQISAARRVLALPGWGLQVHASLDTTVSLLDDFFRLGSPVVLDHYAGGPMPDPGSAELLGRLLAGVRMASVYVKLSAPYRIWKGAEGSADDLARLLWQCVPDRIVWGSDWPHTGGSGGKGRSPDAIEQFREVDNDAVLQSVLACLPDEDARHRLLVRNPAALYGFDA